jgi:hypothetical protein
MYFNSFIHMSDVDEEIRRVLLKKFGEKQVGAYGHTRFLAGEELEYAVAIIREKVNRIRTQAERLNSVDLAIELNAPRKPIRTTTDFPQNGVRLTSLVAPSTGSGLCPLPNRVDCLTGAGATYPEVQLESDLANSVIYTEPVNVALDEEVSTQSAGEKVLVKRMRIKNI